MDKNAKALRFYRVETELAKEGSKFGSGMYSGVWIDAMANMTESSRHPMIWSDSKLNHLEGWQVYGTMLFAFTGMEQLRFWVYKDEWKRELKECGYVLSVYEAKGYHGDTQAVFYPDTATLIERLPLI